jgi:H+-transporting ATPase
MPPNDDVERPRASSGAERQKSIVSMTEFEGMDEFTALQKYILFYRDTRTNPHAEKSTKKKAWYEFWKSGSPTAAVPIEDSGAVPDERKFFQLLSLPSRCAQHGSHLHHVVFVMADTHPVAG